MSQLVVTLIIVVIVDFTGGQYPGCASCPNSKSEFSACYKQSVYM